MLVSGCTSYGVITNAKQNSKAKPVNDNYAIKSVIQNKPQGKIAFVLAFSGGGTRAAALAYGVLKELEETRLDDGQPLLNEVDIISAVSGGAFTAAYYGLNGKKTFKNFRDKILLQDIESELISAVINPLRWFSETGRTQLAIDYYSKHLFADKRFADLNKPGSPLILINASDLSNGVRFSFVQEYFDFICSDINKMPIGKAVAASTAVPVLFNPVILKNHQPCNNHIKTQLQAAKNFAIGNEELTQVLAGLEQYGGDYPYLHLVDGGITDNLGLRAVYEAIELAGGPKAFLKAVNKNQTEHIVTISVDASTKSGGSGINLSNKVPTTLQTVNAITDIQIHRYNRATNELFKDSMRKWSEQLSTENNQVKPHFIQLNFTQLESDHHRQTFNQIPTSLELTEDQIDLLISAGQRLLRENPNFQNLMQKLRAN